MKSLKTTVSIETENGNIEKIESTPGHKYYVPLNTIARNPNEELEHVSYEGLTEKWVSACDLEKGDKVLLSDGKYGIVKEVKTKECKEYITYNFEVEDYHTYYVGKTGVLVHNAGCGGSFKKYTPDEIARKGNITVNEFHHEVKPKILKDSPKKLGKNPDILLDRNNIVGLKSRINEGSYNTYKTLEEYIRLIKR